MIDIRSEVEEAENRIRKYIRETPLELSSTLGDLSSPSVFLKLENLQHTGSFKVRGALNKLLSLSDDEKRKGVATASTGNHALAVAFGLRKLGIPGTIFLPENVSKTKRQKLERFEIDVEFRPGDPKAVETYARQFSLDEGLVYISPYNDSKVIGGQGTIGVELTRQEPSIDSVFVAVGGGGLISGIGGYLKNLNPETRIIGCLPENSPVMYESVKAERILDWSVKETLSDGTAGGIESESITFEPCQRLVDYLVTVTEAEIVTGLKLLFEDHRLVVEGSAAVAVAAFLKKAEELQGKGVAIVLCGGNVNIKKFKELVF
jgi:threonine dehydratase